MVYISRYVLSKNAISLIHSKTGFTSKVNVYPGSLALNIPFKSLWITGCLPNDIQLVVGKIDDNTALAVFWTEYSQMDSLNNFAWNSVLSLTLAIKGSIFRLDENLNQQMVYGGYCLHVLGVPDFISKLITFSDKVCYWNTFHTLCMPSALDVQKEDE